MNDNENINSAKTWYVSCSPRSPEKIAPELKLMISAENMIWDGIYTKKEHKRLGLKEEDFANKKYEFGESKTNNQNRIAENLANLDDFKGDTHSKEASFSIRDRVAPMKTYGLLYTDSNHKLRITPAGRMIIEDRRPKEVFLKQFLKWQYPSYQHGTARPRPGNYPKSQFNIFPFVATLDLIFNLDGLTKYEIAIFALTTRRFIEIDLVKNEIKEFRNHLGQVEGKNPRKQFVYDFHYQRFYDIYKEEFNSGKKIREGKTGHGMQKYVETKIRNSFDIADATIRYFRYSGLLSTRGNRITILQNRKDDIIEILENEYRIYPYDDVDKFHSNYGNHKIPVLGYENRDILLSKIISLTKSSEEVLELIKKINPKSKRYLVQFDNLDSKDVEELKDVYYDVQQNLLLLNRDALVIKLQNPKIINEELMPELAIFLKKNKEIIEEIENRYVVDKNSVFEYVIWRAMVAIGDAIEYKNNFIIDEELNIVHHAAGNQGDMEIYYDDFTLLVEVTTSSGATQFNMEKEPVTRHYENLRDASHSPTYCVFIAKSINENTYKEFFRYNRIRETKIIPIELITFITLVKWQSNLLKENKSISSKELKKLFDDILSINHNDLSVSDWKQHIMDSFDDFKTD